LSPLQVALLFFSFLASETWRRLQYRMYTIVS
jgi:hypothetical protein